MEVKVGDRIVFRGCKKVSEVDWDATKEYKIVHKITPCFSYGE